jgi:hypothetical protein
VYRMVEEWTTCMRLLSWRRHQGTMLKNCILILPVSDPAKQAAQVVKHHVFIMTVSLIKGWRKLPEVSHWRMITMLYWIHLSMSGIRTNNFSDDKYWCIHCRFCSSTSCEYIYHATMTMMVTPYMHVHAPTMFFLVRNVLFWFVNNVHL